MTTEVPPTFVELGAPASIAEALSAKGIERAFPIQAMAIPLALEGKDLIGQAKTGTGKTLGFGIPLLSRLDLDARTPKQPQALVIVPTRELCVQVANDLETASSVLGARVLAVYGGRAYEPQVEALAKGVEVVVGTPGRVIDLATRKDLDLSKVRVLVLDEADEMLDMGFLPDVERIVTQLPADRQTMLFSATMPGQIVALARRYMQQPTHIRAITPGDDNATVDSIEQHVWRTHPMDKEELLSRILQADGRGLTMVFTRTKRRAQAVADDMTARGFAAASVHGDLGQGAREQALRAFRSGKVDVLIATDVAARGIDVDGVTHVVNYECTDDEKTYLHRIGRTGRAGASGVAITFVDWADTARWQMINRALGLPFAEPIETYSTSDHVYTGLGIPTTVTGKLPKASRTRAGLEAEEIEDLGETGKKKPTGDRPKRDGQRGTREHGRSGRDGAGKGGDRRSDKPKGAASSASSDKPSRAPRQRRRTKRVSGEGAPATPNA